MLSKLLKVKRKELYGFLHIIKGKLSGNDKERMAGANEALNALEEERLLYMSEKKEAASRADPELGSYRPHSKVPEDKVIRESNNRDISGY